jgi:crotonobetainyl-CoA:carnitine CoA-transferase CaiB-like acyl-CoA transferase
VYEIRELITSEYMMGKKEKVNHPTDGIIDLPSIENSKSNHAPMLGEHTFEILSRLGLKKDEIVRLKGDKVVDYLQI